MDQGRGGQFTAPVAQAGFVCHVAGNTAADRAERRAADQVGQEAHGKVQKEEQQIGQGQGIRMVLWGWG